MLGIRAEPTISRLLSHQTPPWLAYTKAGRYIARVRTNTVLLRTKKCPTLSTIFPQNLLCKRPIAASQ